MMTKKKNEDTAKGKLLKDGLVDIISITFGAAGVGLASKGFYDVISSSDPDGLYYLVVSPLALAAAGLVYTFGTKHRSYQAK